MNKEFFQRIFSQQMGYVYAFTGTVPEGEDRAAYITEQFAQAAGTNLVNTIVVELPTFGATVIYNHAETDNISSPVFQVITDLVPDPIPEPPVVLETAPEETPPAEPV